MIASMSQRSRALSCYERRKISPAVTIAKFWHEMHPIMVELGKARAKRAGLDAAEMIAQANAVYQKSSMMVKGGIKMNEKKREVLAGKELARMKSIALEELGYIPTRKEK